MAYETAIAVISFSGLYCLLKLATNTDGEKHPAPKLLYVLMSLWYVVGLLALGQNIADYDPTPAAQQISDSIVYLYRAFIIVSLLMTFYYVIYFIKSLMEWISGVWSKRRNKENMEM